MATVKEAAKNFQALAENEVLSHGYILYGQSLKRQRELAMSLANFLENGKFEETKKPLIDAMFIDGETEGLGIDVARSFSDFLYLKPARSARRTLVVSGAQALTTQAQNALLKIAEEPPASSLVILVVRDLGALLLPLLSRFQKVFITGPRLEGEMDEGLYANAKQLVGKFLGASKKGQSDLIKTLVSETPELVDSFMVVLLEELNKHPKENAQALSEVLSRYTAMNQFSVNRRLQLETIIDFL